MPGPTHEDPILVVLPARADPGQELAAFCGHEVVRHYDLPPVWALEGAGIDLPGVRPDLVTVTRDALPEVVAALTRLCDAEALDALVSRRWADVDEMVRDHYLRRSTLQTFAAIFKVAPKSLERAPPPLFVTDRVHEWGFEVEYRLAASGLPPTPVAPPQEGSLVYYPFDPQNAGGRAEGGLEEGPEVVLEGFAYAAARALHRDALERVGRDRGWRVVDPAAA